MCHGKAIAGNDINKLSTDFNFRETYSPEFESFVIKARKKRAHKGEVLFVQGAAAEELFLITAGRVKLNKVFEDGNELTLEMRKPGDFVGENIFLTGARYSVSAYCMEDTTTCVFNKNEFEQLILNHPKVGLQVIKIMSERISWLSRRVRSLSLPNIEDRLIDVLFNIAKEHGTQCPRGILITFPLTHEELSMLTGAHRVSITRAMKVLKRTGKIIFEDRKLILPMPKEVLGAES